MVNILLALLTFANTAPDLSVLPRKSTATFDTTFDGKPCTTRSVTEVRDGRVYHRGFNDFEDEEFEMTVSGVPIYYERRGKDGAVQLRVDYTKNGTRARIVKKGGKVREKEIAPGTFESHTSSIVMRGLPLAPGAEFPMTIFSPEYAMSVKMILEIAEKTEMVATPVGCVECLKGTYRVGGAIGIFTKREFHIHFTVSPPFRVVRFEGKDFLDRYTVGVRKSLD